MGRQSRDVMLALKNGRLIGSPPVPVWDAMASLIKQSVSRLGPLASFLSPTAILVPVPKSALLQKGSLWVPEPSREFDDPRRARTESVPAVDSDRSHPQSGHKHFIEKAEGREALSDPRDPEGLGANPRNCPR